MMQNTIADWERKIDIAEKRALVRRAERLSRGDGIDIGTPSVIIPVHEVQDLLHYVKDLECKQLKR